MLSMFLRDNASVLETITQELNKAAYGSNNNTPPQDGDSESAA